MCTFLPNNTGLDMSMLYHGMFCATECQNVAVLI